MDQRYLQLLTDVVGEYIRVARPVSSAFITRQLDLPFSSATVRSILHELDTAGFLMQPHVSAGRVPTDKGYRHYVEESEEETVSAADQRGITAALKHWQAEYHLARAASKVLAHYAQAIAISAFLTRGEVQEAGLNEVLQQPEGDNVATVKEISAVLQKVEQSLDELAAVAAESAVYIGTENPFLPAQHTSMLVKAIERDNETVILVLLGPKRMPYQRNLSVLETLAALMER